MITISKELLVNAGYKCWVEFPANEPHLAAKWQKCIYDTDGSRMYFININESLGWNPHQGGGEESHNWWPSIQFDIVVEDSTQSIEVRLIQWFNESGKWSNLSIETMETYIEHFFTTLNGIHYEK